MENKTHWVEETIESIVELRSVSASDALKNRLKCIPMTSQVIRQMIPTRAIWLAAASITLIVGINIVSIYSTHKTADAGSIESDYFSYLNQL